MLGEPDQLCVLEFYTLLSDVISCCTFVRTLLISFPLYFYFFLKSVNHFNVLDLEIWLPSLLGSCLKACRAVSMGLCAHKIYKLLVLLRDTSFGSSVLALCIWLVPNNAEQIKLFKYWFIWI